MTLCRVSSSSEVATPGRSHCHLAHRAVSSALNSGTVSDSYLSPDLRCSQLFAGGLQPKKMNQTNL